MTKFQNYLQNYDVRKQFFVTYFEILNDILEFSRVYIFM
jgi:hypothetical protein